MLRDGVTDLEAPTLSILTSAVATVGAAMPKPRLLKLMWRMNFGALIDDAGELLGSGLLGSMLRLLRGADGTSSLPEPGR